MIRIIIALAIPALALVLMPASSSAQHARSFVERQSYAGQKQQAAKAKKAKTQRATSTRQQSPSGNPAWDVYVNGEYVGSDPDPRIRETLKAEARGRYGLRD